MEAHGQRGLEWVMSLDEDVVWIGALRGQYVHGKAAMRRILSRDRMSHSRRGHRLRSGVLAETLFTIVTGQLGGPGPVRVSAKAEPATELCVRTESGWMEDQLHLHVSNKIGCSEGE